MQDLQQQNLHFRYGFPVNIQQRSIRLLHIQSNMYNEARYLLHTHLHRAIPSDSSQVRLLEPSMGGPGDHAGQENPYLVRILGLLVGTTLRGIPIRSEETMAMGRLCSTPDCRKDHVGREWWYTYSAVQISRSLFGPVMQQARRQTIWIPRTPRHYLRRERGKPPQYTPAHPERSAHGHWEDVEGEF